jgi:hypothetical protein
MHPQTKSAIKSLVLDLRHTLEDELAIVLKRFGLFTDRAWSLDEPPDILTSDADRETWQRIVAVVRRGMEEGRTLPQASDDYVRESAFTFLNRLVGLKCLEVRGIMAEVITTRDIYGGRSQAHRDYRDDNPTEARAADDALPACLAAVCRHVNDELIGYLFDPDDDHSMVWPRYAVIKNCIAKINALDESVWKEDEIIGWIYQFYNAEEKVAIRKRGKPQTPHDVAVINQFFTPRWVIKFLVDNTLGRLWLEMHPDSPRVRAKCDYLIPEPLPVGAEGRGSGKEGEFAPDPDSPINNPHAAPRREEKPVAEIRLLDPACGTMHFGHYACEVFDAMYRDARDWSHVQIDDRDIPGAILQNNLYGVDIDQRAVQLAALSLFMKAHTMHPQAQVRQVNLVVADATLPDGDIKKKFLARYAKDKAVQKAFAQVLEDLDHMAQVGSLLRVEERLRELLVKAGHAAAAREAAALDPRRQRELPGMKPEVRQMDLAEVAEKEQATAWTPHYTLQELRDDLRTFARQALDEHDLNAQLFATEADKAVRLLDVLMSKYDVVVMNPPYGNTTELAQRCLNANYPNTAINLYAAFVERSVSLIEAGFVGGLVSRTFFAQPQYAKLRRKVILENALPRCAIDLGPGVLDDATVDTAAITFEVSPGNSNTRDKSSYFRIDSGQDQESQFLETLNEIKSRKKAARYFLVSKQTFDVLPDGQFLYWAPSRIVELLSDSHRLDPTVADVRVGLQTGDDKRFVRQFWEVLPQIGDKQKWVPFAKGGDFCRHYADLDLVVNWTNDGEAIKRLAESKYGSVTRTVKNQGFYMRGGITFPNSSSLGFSARHMPDGTIASVKGQGIYLEESDVWWILGLLNSRLVEDLLDIIHPGKDYQAGDVKRVPIVPSSNRFRQLVGMVSRRIFAIKRAWDMASEICTRFCTPWLLQLAQPQGEAFVQGLGCVVELLGNDAPKVPLPPAPLTLAALLDAARAIEKAADARLQALQAEIDEAVYDLYEISPADRALIERELGDRPLELVWPQMEGKPDKEKRREHIRRFFSYFALQAVRQDKDGVVPLAGCAAREPYLAQRIRAQLEAQFGSATAYQLEQDAAEYLGRPLEEWLRREFFARFHVRLYKNRPILWHLTSLKGYFAVLLDYHHLTHDTLPKVQSLYLWPQMEEVRTRLAAARAGGATVKQTADLEDEMADLEDCNKRLESVIQATVAVGLPEWAKGPYREGKAPYNPDLDDGVRVNLLPLQEAGLLPARKVV